MVTQMYYQLHLINHNYDILLKLRPHLLLHRLQNYAHQEDSKWGNTCHGESETAVCQVWLAWLA